MDETGRGGSDSTSSEALRRRTTATWETELDRFLLCPLASLEGATESVGCMLDDGIGWEANRLAVRA